MMKKRGQIRELSQYNFFKKDCRGIIADYLPWLLIGIAVLAIVMISIFLLKGKGLEFIEQVKNIFKGR